MLPFLTHWVCSLTFFPLPSPSPVKSEAPVPHPQEKPALSDEEIEKKCKSIIDEFLHINDYKVSAVGGCGAPRFL